MQAHQEDCTRVASTALLVIAEDWKRISCFSIVKGLGNMVYLGSWIICHFI